jgi:hypothetical protein
LPEPEFVYMTCPGIEGVWGPVTREAFDLLYANRDPAWEEASASALAVQAASAVLETEVPDLSRLQRGELDEVARSHGLEPDEFRNKTDLISAIESVVAPSTPNPEE